MALFMDFHAQGVTVRCKGCPTVIVDAKGRTSAYAELVLAILEPSGIESKHETGMCQACRGRLWESGGDVGELDRLYATDIEQMIVEANHAGNAQADIVRISARMAARTPLRVLMEKGRGE